MKGIINRDWGNKNAVLLAEIYMYCNIKKMPL